MKRRSRSLLIIVVLATMLTSLAAQVVSAGTPIRCGQACQTISYEAPPTPEE